MTYEHQIINEPLKAFYSYLAMLTFVRHSKKYIRAQTPLKGSVISGTLIRQYSCYSFEMPIKITVNFQIRYYTF